MSENVLEAKSQLRKLILARRTSSRAQHTAEKFADRLVELCRRLRVQNVGCYISFGSEPQTRQFMEVASQAGLVIAAPKLSSDSMDFSLFTGELVHNPLGFDEPAAVRRPAKLDLIVAPALAVTEAGVRLGRGGGYFDRYLEKNSIPTVALVFDDEVLPELPHELHDRRVDFVITPEREITCSSQ